MNLKTGDLILCDDLEYGDWGIFSWFIKFMSKSDFSHIGMIVKDPDFIFRTGRYAFYLSNRKFYSGEHLQ